tara:strand:+ start:10774 stop:11565 length:792 start_codon:yes stop_codon:yes gene_type:complete
MGKKSSDPADVKGAARVEAEASKEAGLMEMYANKPNQTNVLGTTTWNPTTFTDPITGKKMVRWSESQDLNPTTQRSVDALLGQFADRSELAQGMNQRIVNEMGMAPDFDQFGDYQDFNFDDSNRQAIEDAFYAKETSRLDDRYGREAQAMEIDLRNKGLRPGDQAYDSAMANFTTGKNDAYEQARLNAIIGGGEESDRQFQQQFDSYEAANMLRDARLQDYIGKRGFSLEEQDKLSALNDLTSFAGLVTGQGVGGKTDSGTKS